VAVWGFPNFRSKSGVIINARAETALDKKTFRESLLSRRCVIPSTGFFEWTKTGAKKKYLFRETGKSLLYMAGIYNDYGNDPHHGCKPVCSGNSHPHAGYRASAGDWGLDQKRCRNAEDIGACATGTDGRTGVSKKTNTESVYLN
jgi:hypothetical protein